MIYCANTIKQGNVTLQSTTDCGLSNCATELSGGFEHCEYASRFMPHTHTHTHTHTYIYHDGDDANDDNAWGLIQGIILGFL